MNKVIAEDWVKALRSGDYKQTEGRLYDGEGYCCLGVLCKVLGYEFEEVRAGYYQCKGIDQVLPREVVDKAEMVSTRGRLDDVTVGTSSLTELNDSGASFEVIADLIEQHTNEL